MEELPNILTEFLEGLVHEVLHLREVYARELFQRHRLYDVMVRKSRHPQLNEYIHAVVQSLKDPLIQGVVKQVAVLILNAHGLVIEKFIADLKMQAEILPSVNAEDIESALRDCLLKLQYMDSCLKPLPKGCTFEIVAYASSQNAVSQHSWVRSEPPPRTTRPNVVPIKSAKAGAGAFQLQLYAEA
eukprot:jgi/Botrbrau1/13772/Bobra.0056s0027.1